MRNFHIPVFLVVSLALSGCEFIECGCLVITTFAGCADDLGCFRPSVSSELHGEPPSMPGRLLPATPQRGLTMAY